MTIKKQDGYILVLVLVSVSVMFFLASTLYNYTSTRTFWTYKHTNKIKTVSEARTIVDSASGDIEYMLHSFRNTQGKSITEINTDFATYFTQIETDYNVTIRNLMVESCEYPNNPDLGPCYPVSENTYSYAYQIVYEDDHVISKKNFFISMIPSFLHFALGSTTDITINGGAYIDGDIYTKRNMYVTDVANYTKKTQTSDTVIETVLYSEPSTMSTVTTDSKLYLGNAFKYCNNGPDTRLCYTIDEPNELFIKNMDNFYPQNGTSLSYWEYQQVFNKTAPEVMSYNQNFLDVNFEQSYCHYIDEAATMSSLTKLTACMDLINDPDREFTEPNISTEITNYVQNGYLKEVSSITEIKDNGLSDTSLVFVGSRLTLNESIQESEFNPNKWLIVDGDLFIENYTSLPYIVEANILVTGDIVISGNVAFKSTIYALGEGLIHGTEIESIDDNKLVLLTYGNIQFSKSNTFAPVNQSGDKTSHYFNEPDLHGFFYTDKQAVFYGVGSYINLKGGIYTNDSENQGQPACDPLLLQSSCIELSDSTGLLINSYRGNVVLENDAFKFSSRNTPEYARVVVRHDPTIFNNLNKGLPINDQVNYAFEHTTVKSK